MKSFKIKDKEYYEVCDGAGEKMILDKEVAGPAFFRGCWEFALQSKLGDIDYDEHGECYLSVILEISISEHFKNWVEDVFGIKAVEVSDKNKWKKLLGKKKTTELELIVFKGLFDVYSILRYFYSINTTMDTPWLDRYKELHNKIKSNIN